MKSTLTLEVDYNPELTDPEGLAAAMDRLLQTALSTPRIMEEYGNPAVGEFFVAPPIDANKIDEPEVVINLSGGMVQEVYASGTLGDLTVVDWDVGCGDEGYTEVLHQGEPLRAYVAHPIIYALERLAGSPTQAVIDAAGRDRSKAPTG